MYGKQDRARSFNSIRYDYRQAGPHIAALLHAVFQFHQVRLPASSSSRVYPFYPLLSIPSGTITGGRWTRHGHICIITFNSIRYDYRPSTANLKSVPFLSFNSIRYDYRAQKCRNSFYEFVRFQFHQVRLPELANGALLYHILHFQFHQVRLPGGRQVHCQVG